MGFLNDGKNNHSFFYDARCFLLVFLPQANERTSFARNCRGERGNVEAAEALFLVQIPAGAAGIGNGVGKVIAQKLKFRSPAGVQMGTTFQIFTHIDNEQVITNCSG
jgi:hypothetical protein